MYQYREKEQGKNAAVLAEAIENLVLLLAPFTPHITEELWQAIGHTDSVHAQSWPQYDLAAMAQEEVTIVVQINGKMRDRLTLAVDLPQAEVEAAALAQPKIAEQLAGQAIKKVVVIPNKLVNIVL